MAEESKRAGSEKPPMAVPPVEDPAQEKNSGKALVLRSTEKVPPHKSPPVYEKLAHDAVEKIPGDSIDRDAALAQVETEKRMALIKAWEESEKSKADNRAYKKLSAVEAWENAKRAAVEARLKQIEEEIDREKAEHVEQMKNKMAKVHKEAEEKKAIVEARRGEDTLKIEELAAKFRATGNTPKRTNDLNRLIPLDPDAQKDMGEEETKKVEAETSQQPDSASESVEKPTANDTAEVVEKCSADSTDRGDAALGRVETEKRLALVKAWEVSEKTKADNKAIKKLSAIGAWENTQGAAVEAQLKQIEEKFERKKAEYAEQMKNKMAEIHKAAEEKRAMVKAKRGEDAIKVEEIAAKCRATGSTPKKLFGCLSC
ncbi:hypothetical protein RJ639_033844 [Escallonia herrerae]|uniref:Remorin C-terminal domain-containing protein n=1 Tax=Escallonia herrerae TaxID=1293975 RepID=A0AA88X0F2_9ASTE|nr:hypothetical protein RJ639_033844 [Escallonia herrerae]